MFTKKHKFVGSEAAGLALAVFLCSGILQATPITHATGGPIQGSNQLTTSTSLSATARVAVADLSVSRAWTTMTTTTQPSYAFGIDSYKKIPEPQSLVMVGAGLLSMAGLIRRRLLRQG